MFDINWLTVVSVGSTVIPFGILSFITAQAQYTEVYGYVIIGVIVLHTWLFYAKCAIELIKLILFSYTSGGFSLDFLVNGILAIGAHILLSSAILFSGLYFIVEGIKNMDNPLVSNLLRYGLAVLKVVCVGLLAYKVPVFAVI